MKQERKKRQCLHILGGTAFWAIVGACVLITMVSLLYKGQGMSLFGYRLSIVLTDSMSPSFHAGSLLFVKEVSPTEIEVGDILAYQARNDVVTHRVVKIDNESGHPFFITQGDANAIPDTNWVSPDQIQGVAVLWIEHLGRFLLWLKNPLTLISIICGVLSLMILKYAWHLIEEEETAIQLNEKSTA